MLQRPFSTCLALLLTISLVGCASTKKRYEKASELEAQGRYAEAAGHYIRVLQKDPGYADARNRLLDVGSRALEGYLAEAQRLEGQSRFEDATGTLRALDGLRSRAASVGVTLPVPDDYLAYYQRMVQNAIAEVIAGGEQAEEAGNWSQALSHYDRAQSRYQLTAAQHADLDRARARVLVRWADEDLKRDYPRAAWGHAQQAIDILGPEANSLKRAFRIQEEALRRGTRRVAFVPFWQIERWMRDAPRTTLQDLNDVLMYDFWSDPPLFIAVADPVQVRRELRALRYDRSSVDRFQAAEVGRLFDAHYVVTGEAASFERAEKVHKEKTEKGRTRGRNAMDTTYVVQEYDLTLTAEVSYQIVEVASRRVVAERTVSADATDRLERGVYGGRYTDLDLTAAERRLFDPEELAETERELEIALIDNLAARLAEQVYGGVLERIR